MLHVTMQNVHMCVNSLRIKNGRIGPKNNSERHRVNDRKILCLKKNLEDEILTEEDLRKILRVGSEGNDEFQKLISRVQTCNSNIVRSDDYFHRK